MKKAIVTGASGGLGIEICKKLVANNFKLIVIDLADKETIENLLSEVNDGIELILDKVDFSKTDELQSSLDSCLPDENLTVLVNNAGLSIGGGISDATLAEWELMIKVNLTAPFILSQAFINNAKKFNIQGSIINISSMVGIIGAKKPGYAASKAGLLGLTKSIAMQSGPKIRCNAIYPGAMDTPMTADWDEHTRHKIIKNTPLQRIAQPAEIANIVGFLADDNESSFITGAVINATGGQYLGQ